MAQSAVLISGVTYMAYKFMRQWVLPTFFDIPDPEQNKINLLQNQMNEIQNSTKFIMDSVVQTLQIVSEQQEQLNRSDIGIVKSMLLQNQLSAIPNGNVEGSKEANGLNDGKRRIKRYYEDEESEKTYEETVKIK